MGWFSSPPQPLFISRNNLLLFPAPTSTIMCIILRLGWIDSVWHLLLMLQSDRLLPFVSVFHNNSIFWLLVLGFGVFLLACLCLWLFVLVWFFVLSNFCVCVFVVFVYFPFLSSASQNKPQKTKPVLEKKFMLLTATTILNFLIWFF